MTIEELESTFEYGKEQIKFVIKSDFEQEKKIENVASIQDFLLSVALSFSAKAWLNGIEWGKIDGQVKDLKKITFDFTTQTFMKLEPDPNISYRSDPFSSLTLINKEFARVLLQLEENRRLR